MKLKRAFACELQAGKAVMIPRNSLWEALSLPMKEHMIISFAGGGGKTTSMFWLADELAGLGKRVIVTTSTHIRRPQNRHIVPAEKAETVENFIKDHEEWAFPSGGWVLVAARPAEEGKLKSMELSQLEKLAALSDVLLVEADGAKCLPLKLPREGEPVHLNGTDAVIGCAGLDCIGKSWEEMCFRFYLASEIFGRSMKKAEILPEHAAGILISEKGTRKGVGAAEYRMILNKADDEERMAAAEAVVKAMGESWTGKCAVTHFAEER